VCRAAEKVLKTSVSTDFVEEYQVKFIRVVFFGKKINESKMDKILDPTGNY
jgi:hypothetical protein